MVGLDREIARARVCVCSDREREGAAEVVCGPVLVVRGVGGMRSCGGARSHGLLIVVFLVGHAVDAVVAAGNRSDRAEVSVVCGSISAAGSSRGRGGAVRGCVFDLGCKTVATGDGACGCVRCTATW